MTAPVLVVVAFLVAMLVGAAFGFGSPGLGFPVAILGVLFISALEVFRRRQQSTDIHGFRAQADAQKADFTAEDRRTQVRDDV